MKNLVLIFAAVLSVNALMAQVKDSASTGGGYSVQQCIDYAYKNQSSMVNAGIDEQMAKAKVNEVFGMGLPQINASFDAKYFPIVPTSVVDVSRFPGVPPGIPPGTLAGFQMAVPYNTTAGFDASQLIFSSSYFVGLQASKTYLELSRKNVERTKIELAVAVSKAYYSVLVNQERFELLKANVDRLKKMVDETKAMNDNGLVEKIDLSRIQLTYNNLLVEKEKVERLLSIGIYLLKFQMGMPLETNITLTDKLTAVKDQLKMPVENKVNFSNRVEYSLLQTSKKLNELDLKRYRLSYLPTIVAYGSYASTGFGTDTKIFTERTYWFPMSVVGLKVSMPIFDGFQNKYRIQSIRHTIEKNMNDIKNLEQGISMEAEAARITYSNQLASIDVQKKNLELAEEVYKVSKIKYDQGVGSNLEVINAESSYKEAQSNYYNALYDAIVSQLDYQKANGIIK